jgi:hypothetical protein
MTVRALVSSSIERDYGTITLGLRSLLNDIGIQQTA